MASEQTNTDSDFTSGLVGQAELDFYRANGVVCIRQVIGSEIIDGLRKAAAEVIECRTARAEEAGSPRPTGPQFHSVMRASEDSEVLADFRMNSILPKVARDLMQSRKVILFGDTLFDKEPGAKVKTPWHHDIPYWPVRGEQVCSTWLALDHVTKANGAMEYIAGSHRWGRMFRPEAFANLTEVDEEGGFEALPDFDEERSRHRILTWDMEPGDVLIHQGLTLHGAGENTRLDQCRRAYAPRYVGEKATWRPEPFSAKRNPETLVLQKGDPLDLHGIFPVALDLGEVRS